MSTAPLFGLTPSPASLRPGDLMFGPIGGFVPGFLPVGVGQVALAPRKARLTWRRWWQVRHVGVVVEASETISGATGTIHRGQVYLTGVITAPRIVQAMPHGAEEVDLRLDLHWTRRHVYVRPAYTNIRAHMMMDVATAARGYVGTPYNFLTYGALAARALRLPISERVLRRWISTRHDMMCSQLADQALADAGFHVFDDGRLPQDVVPAELFRQLLTMPGTKYLIPGQAASDGWVDALGRP